MKRSDLTEFALEEENFKLQIKRATEPQAHPQIATYMPAPAASAAATSQAAPSPAPAAQESKEDSSVYITSPMVGTFYSSPSPESEPFLKVGDAVQPDTVVCIIEAMKIMNEIQAEQKGHVAEILVENGQPVEFGQRLYRLT